MKVRALPQTARAFLRVALSPIVGCLVILAIAASAMSQNQRPPARTPFVFVHYMHCYVLGSFDPADPRVRDYDRLYDPAVSSPLDYESQWFAPEEAARAADGVSATRSDFALMEMAGFDAAGVLIGPAHLPKSKFAPALHMAAKAAETSRVKIIPELWFDAGKVNFVEYGQSLADFLAAHPGAQAKIEGKPAFLISHQADDGGGLAMRASTNAKLDSLFAAWGGLKGVYLFVNLSFGTTSAASNAFALAADALGQWTPQDDWTSRHSDAVVSAAAMLGKDYVYPVAFAFYQRRASLVPWEYGNSFGATRFIDAWMRVLRHKPGFVEVMTWNDFSEDTAVVPSNTHGSVFLHLTRYFIDRLRRGDAGQFDKERVVLLHPRQLTEAQLDNANATVKNYGWRHRAPIVDYVDVVTFLKSAARVRITVGNIVQEVTVPAGMHQTLLIAELPNIRPREDTVRVGRDSLPHSQDGREVIRVPAFEAAQPKVEVIRDQTIVLSVTSRAGFANRGSYQDLTLIATESESP